MKNIGKTIQEHLEIKEMTQREIGDKLGLTQKAISKYVTGKSQPSLDVLVKICKILDIDLKIILEINSSDDTRYVINTKDEYDLLSFYRSISTENKIVVMEIINSLKKSMK